MAGTFLTAFGSDTLAERYQVDRREFHLSIPFPGIWSNPMAV